MRVCLKQCLAKPVPEAEEPVRRAPCLFVQLCGRPVELRVASAEDAFGPRDDAQAGFARIGLTERVDEVTFLSDATARSGRAHAGH